MFKYNYHLFSDGFWGLKDFVCNIAPFFRKYNVFITL